VLIALDGAYLGAPSAQAGLRVEGRAALNEAGQLHVGVRSKAGARCGLSVSAQRAQPSGSR
jgi:hypothetical protein